MNEFIKKLMTEEEFNSLNSLERMAIEAEARKANGYLDWHILTRYGNFTEDTVRKFADRIDWNEVSHYKHIREAFIEEFKDKLNWQELTQYHRFNKDQLLQYIDYIDWDRAPTFQPAIDEDVIDVVMASSKKDEFNWHGALVNIPMSETFLEKYAVKANKWEIVSYYQDLSEKFMEKFADKLNWNYISQKQHLSRNFMVKHFDKLNKFWLKQYQKNWDDNIEKDYKLSKDSNAWLNDQNFLTDLRALLTKYGYDYNTVMQNVYNEL